MAGQEQSGCANEKALGEKQVSHTDWTKSPAGPEWTDEKLRCHSHASSSTWIFPILSSLLSGTNTGLQIEKK